MRQVMKKLNILLPVLLLLAVLLGCPEAAEAGIEEDIPRSSITFEELPEYIGEDFAILHDNIPEFTLWQLKTEAFVSFSPLDALGRTGPGFACLGKETLPQESRGSIGSIQPSGWQTVRYDDLIADKYLYNRCHVIAFALCGDNATPENLFTGTRYLNITLMTQLENSVSQYIQGTGNHVLYRVTPIYQGQNLVASGVQMEGYSIEDHGQTICFNVFVYNIQPGVLIDYETGDSRRDPEYVVPTPSPAESHAPAEEETETLLFSTEDVEAEAPARTSITYVLNTNTMRFHFPYCSSVNSMSERNRQDFTGTREEALALGYQSCRLCNP